MKANKRLINFVIILGIYLLLNLTRIEGFAHAPEFHLPEDTPSESTENQTENPETQNRDNSVDNFQETEVNVQPESDLDNDAVSHSTQNSLNTVWDEALIIWILINPFILYSLKARFSIKKTSKPSLLQ